MDMDGENYRGLHALQLLTGSRGWTLDKLQAAAFDSDQPGFAVLIPRCSRPMMRCPLPIARQARAGRTDRGAAGLELSLERGLGAADPGDGLGRRLRRRLNAPKSEPGNKVMMRLARDTTPEQKLEAL